GSVGGTDGAYSATSSQLTLPSQSAPPTYTNVTTNSVRVNWSAPSGGAVSYKVERCQGDNCTNFSEIAAGVTTLYYDDSGLTSNVNYRYRIRATNATGDGNYSSSSNTLLYNAPAGSVRFR
ncbi:MAG TPA: fibronectin type III domain-containing protein, partial [Candidatus Paceibacterota bacterium]|nr:fibronectin type III domain-containing protein [Candidatus Paceibacterota bacterium]